MNSADEKLSDIAYHHLDKDTLKLVPQLISRSSGGSEYIDVIAVNGLEKGLLTVYEAFQLYEIHDRIWTRIIPVNDYCNAIISMNLALMAKLFEEPEMYKAFCADAEKRYDEYAYDMKKSNGGKLPKTGNELFDDFKGFLKGDREHLELLSYKRSHIKGAARQSTEVWHFCYFPFDLFKYEDELLKVVKGEIEHYPVDKNLSPIVCEMITAIELRNIELD